MSNNNPKNLWDLINNKVNKPINKDAVQDIAKNVSPNVQHDSEKMRQLVRQLSSVLGIKLTSEKEADILKYLKENKFTGIDSINKLLKK
jgi:uncharacterized protein YpuA (DUF1002 family)